MAPSCFLTLTLCKMKVEVSPYTLGAGEAQAHPATRAWGEQEHEPTPMQPSIRGDMGSSRRTRQTPSPLVLKPRGSPSGRFGPFGKSSSLVDGLAAGGTPWIRLGGRGPIHLEFAKGQPRSDAAQKGLALRCGMELRLLLLRTCPPEEPDNLVSLHGEHYPPTAFPCHAA